MARTNPIAQTHATIKRLARLHYLLIAAAAAQIIIYDAWQLVTLEVILQRWAAVLLLLAAVTVVWYMSHGTQARVSATRLLFGLITADIAFAAFSVYNQRGMASRAVFLFVIPILVSAAARQASATLATAILCIAAYVGAAISYFVINFNEGYSVELYGEVGFYSALFLVTAMLVNAINKD